MKKKCETCKKPFTRNKTLSYKQWNLRRFCSRDCFAPVNSALHKGRRAWNKGMEFSNKYEAIHARFRNMIPKPKKCPRCGRNKFIELCNISQKYLNKKSDWNYLCRKCHMTEDGRLAILKNHAKD